MPYKTGGRAECKQRKCMSLQARSTVTVSKCHGTCCCLILASIETPTQPLAQSISLSPERQEENKSKREKSCGALENFIKLRKEGKKKPMQERQREWLTTPIKRPMFRQSPSTLLLMSMAIYGIKYHFGQLRPAVAVVFPPRFLPRPTLPSVEGRMT